MSIRSGRRGSQEGVELNLAAMLDMAFQLLAFFILTFQPAPVEGEISLRMPRPTAVSAVPGAPPLRDAQASHAQLLRSVNTLTISVRSDAEGTIGSLWV